MPTKKETTDAQEKLQQEVETLRQQVQDQSELIAAHEKTIQKLKTEAQTQKKAREEGKPVKEVVVFEYEGKNHACYAPSFKVKQDDGSSRLCAARELETNAKLRAHVMTKKPSFIKEVEA